jgi:hypothetical protein
MHGTGAQRAAIYRREKDQLAARGGETELEVLQNEVLTGNFPPVGDERTGGRTRAADVDRRRRRPVQSQCRRARMEFGVRAMQFDDGAGGQRGRNRAPRTRRRSVRIARISGAGLRFVNVIEARRRRQPRIGRCRCRFGNAERRYRDARGRDPWKRLRGGRRTEELEARSKTDTQDDGTFQHDCATNDYKVYATVPRAENHQKQA